MDRKPSSAPETAQKPPVAKLASSETPTIEVAVSLGEDLRSRIAKPAELLTKDGTKPPSDPDQDPSDAESGNPNNPPKGVLRARLIPKGTGAYLRNHQQGAKARAKAIEPSAQALDTEGLVLSTKESVILAKSIRPELSHLDILNELVYLWPSDKITETNFRNYLDKKFTSHNTDRKIDPNWSDEVKFAYLDLYILDNPGQPASHIVKQLFPQISEEIQAANRPGTPTRQKWLDREAGDTPASFVRKNYGVWKDGVWDRQGLTKADLRNDDFKLYEALAVWERRHPDDRLNLPTKKEENDRWIDRVKSGDDAQPLSALEQERLRAALRRRHSEEPAK